MNPVNAVCEFLYDALAYSVDCVIDLVFFAIYLAAVLPVLGVFVLLGNAWFGLGGVPGMELLGFLGVVWLFGLWDLYHKRVDNYLDDRQEKLRLPKWKVIRKRI